MENSRTGILGQSAIVDLYALASGFPASSETMLVDRRLTDEPAASARIFRIYTAVPAHYHKTCDEYLVVLSGRAMFAIGGSEPSEISVGKLLFFKRAVVHSFPKIIEEPLVVFSVDTPRRDPGDITFVDPAAGSAETFIRTIKY